jgi:hypothetical protein
MYSILLAILLALDISGCGAAQQCPPANSRRIPFADDAGPEHRIRLTARAYRDGRLRWYGRIVTMPHLRAYLRRSRNLNPPPYLVLEYEEGIDCATLANLRQAFDEDGGCSGETFCSERPILAGIR